MNKGLIIILSITLVAFAASGKLAAQVYKIVDENGNVTYTDEPPNDGTPEMVLPELSVIESDYQPETAAGTQDPNAIGTGEEAAAEEETALTPRELRAMYRDFQVLVPQPDQTFWGTANVVVVSWGAGAPFEDGMSVTVVVNGQNYDAEPSGNLPVTLDRGEHEVYAVLQDERGRRIATSETVRFYVKQATRNIRRG
jgi:hypothetical protein